MGKPATILEFISRHKADLQQAGFDDQFGCFVYFLLSIDGGDEIIYESEDDIVVNCADGCRWLIQVKHSVDSDSRMTDADLDIWKTIDNWISLYSYCKTEAEKNSFFQQGNRLIIYTNKVVCNTFVKQISSLRNGDIEFTTMKSFLKGVEKSVSYYSIVQRLLDFKDVELRKFLLKVEVIDSGDPLSKLYTIFLNKFHNPTKADQIVNELLGKMLREKKAAADSQKQLKYLKEDFMVANKSILNKVGDESLSALSYNEDTISLPINICQWPMVQQMEKIMVVDTNNDEDHVLIMYYGYWYCCENSKQYYYSIQLMTPELEQSIDNSATKSWKLSFQEHHHRVRQNSDNETKIIAGAACFYDTMKMEISHGSQKLQFPFSSGWFLNLSNQHNSDVHWHYDWKHENL